MTSEFESKVDCVAYDAIRVTARGHTDEEIRDFLEKDIPLPHIKMVGEVMASCLHPLRGGPIHGCLLVDFNTGELIPGAVCPFQTKKGNEDAAKLVEQIEASLDNIPF